LDEVDEIEKGFQRAARALLAWCLGDGGASESACAPSSLSLGRARASADAASS
jgi:hypothetical protein